MSAIDDALKYIGNVKNFYSAPNPYPNVRSPIQAQDQITTQLPPGIFSPITQAQIQPHAAGPSDFAQALSQLKNNVNTSLNSVGLTGFDQGTYRITADPAKQALSQAAKSFNPVSTQHATQAQDVASYYPPNISDTGKQVVDTATKYNIPPNILYGMWAAEGRGNTIQPSNPLNVGAVDSNPRNAAKYATPSAGIDRAAQILTGQAPSLMQGKLKKAFENYQKTNDSDKLLQDISNAGWAGDPKTYKQRAKNGYETYYDFVKATPEYQAF